MRAVGRVGALAAGVLAGRLVGCADVPDDRAPAAPASADGSVDLGPPAPVTPEAQSGQRLRAVYWDLGGVKQSVLAASPYANGVVFFDTKLGEECAFTGRLDSAGRDYCVPLAGIVERSALSVPAGDEVYPLSEALPRSAFATATRVQE